MTFGSVHFWSLVPMTVGSSPCGYWPNFVKVWGFVYFKTLNSGFHCLTLTPQTTVNLPLTLLTASWSHRDAQWLNFVFSSVNLSLWFYFPLHLWFIISTVSLEHQKLLRYFFLFLNLYSSPKTYISLIIIFSFLHQDNIQIGFWMSLQMRAGSSIIPDNPFTHCCSGILPSSMYLL